MLSDAWKNLKNRLAQLLCQKPVLGCENPRAGDDLEPLNGHGQR